MHNAQWVKRDAESAVRELENRLRETGHIALRQIKCDVTADTILLSGTVPSYFLKQTAQTIATIFDSEAEIENLIEVVDGRPSKPR